MDDTQKMLRAIINGQSALKQELLGEIKSVKDEIHKTRQEIDMFRQETKGEFKKTNKRIDTIGSQLAYLEDDAPTREEFEELQTSVAKLVS